MIVTDIYAAGEEHTPETAHNLTADLHSGNSLTTLSQSRGEAINQLRILAGLCNVGEFDAATMHLPILERTINGDATDKAALAFSETLGSVAELRRDWKMQFEISFNSKRKFMVRLMTPVKQNPTSNNT